MIRDWYNMGYTRALQLEANPNIPCNNYPRRDIYSAEDEREYIRGFCQRGNDRLLERSHASN